ncbi:COP9 signalosome complex subunit 7b-like [Aplochiton taeniatus]
MAVEQKHSNQLDQFILLAKKARGPTLLRVINQLLEAPGVYVFGQFMELSCIKELAKGPDSGYSQLLNIFAYGVYLDYQAFKGPIPPLNEAQRNKLRHLTIVNLAANMQVIPYSVLLKDLELGSVRQLEDLLIEAVYADVIQGKLDQGMQHLEVDACISRDIPAEGTARITDLLTQWCSNCERVSTSIEKQVDRLSACREGHLITVQQVDTEVENVRRRLLSAPAKPCHDLVSQVEQEGEGAMAGPNPGVERRPTPHQMLSKGMSLASQRH